MDIEALQNTPGHIGPLEIAPRARNEPIENLVPPKSCQMYLHGLRCGVGLKTLKFWTFPLTTL